MDRHAARARVLRVQGHLIGARIAPLAGLAVPLVLWLVALVGVTVAVMIAGQDPLIALSWHRPDTPLYLSIAENGYDAAPCPPGQGEPGDLCGNALVFPGYPLLTAFVALFGLPLGTAAILVAWSFWAGTLVLLGHTFLRGARASAALLAPLALAAFWPGQSFLFTALPISMLVFFAVLALWLLGRRRWLAAGLAAAAALVTDAFGLTVVVAALGWLIATRAPAGAFARVLGPIAAGAVFVLGLMRLQTGRWKPWLDLQNQIPRDLQVPFVTLWDRIEPVFRGSLDVTADASGLQALLVTVIVAAVAVWAVRARARLTAADRLLVGVSLLLWLAPLTFTGNVTHWRIDATLLPLVVLARHLPAQLTFLIAGSALWASVLVSRAMLVGVLP